MTGTIGTEVTLDSCRVFLAPLQRDAGRPTAYILGIGRRSSDAHYVEVLRLEAEGYGAVWQGAAAVRVLPVRPEERNELRDALRAVSPFGGFQFAPQLRSPSTEYRREAGTPLADTLSPLFPESMPLISSGGGSMLAFREFVEGDTPGWPDGHAAILRGRRTLIVIDLDALELARTTALARAVISDLELVAGTDATSRFAAMGRAQAWNQEKGEFFTTAETTRLVEAEREQATRRLVAARYRRAIPRERKASLRTATDVHGRTQNRSGPSVIRSAKVDALKATAANLMPGFLETLSIRARNWAGAPLSRIKRELPPIVDALNADIRDGMGDRVCARFLGRDYRSRFPIWPSRRIALDAPGRTANGAADGEPRSARISELATRQPEVGSDPVTSPTDELEVLATKAGLTEVERDLLFARSKGLSLPSWAQQRGSRYRMHLSDTKNVWRHILAKLRAAMN
jgi:hypothetical protein